MQNSRPPPNMPGNPNIFLIPLSKNKPNKIQQQAYRVLSPVVGSRSASKRAKASRFQAPNQQGSQPGGSRLPNEPRPIFQAPHQGLDASIDLTDDTAPKVGGWKPVATQPVNQMPQFIPVPPANPVLNQFVAANPVLSRFVVPNPVINQLASGNFGSGQVAYGNSSAQVAPGNAGSGKVAAGNSKQNQSTTDTYKIKKRGKKKNTQKQRLQVPSNVRGERNVVRIKTSNANPLDAIPIPGELGQEEDGDIKWELNTLDDEPGEKKDPDVKPPVVQQGSAANIKLTINKQKPKIAPTFVSEPKPVPTSASESKSRMFVNTLSTPEKNRPKNVPKMKKVKQLPPIVESPFSRLSTGKAKGIPRSFLVSHQHSPVQPKPEHVASIPRSFLATRSQAGEFGAIQPHAPQPEKEPRSNPIPILGPAQPMYVDTQVESAPQQYSPSDAYDDSARIEQSAEGDMESPDREAGCKRLSAFQRLGPQEQPKKPKLTINLMCNKDQSVREVVEPEEIIPVHLRQDIIDSMDETVMKYLPSWPWKKPLWVRKTVTARSSKSVMLLEQEQMEESYDRDSAFIQVTVRGYPNTWRKEDVLDAMLDAIKGKSFIPCFVEFSREECKFMVIRSRPSLTAIHKLGFYIRKDEVQLQIYLHKIEFTLKQLDYLPRLVLRKRLSKGYDSERRLDLKAFTLQPDISHFIYFPLNRSYNQMELVQLQSTVAWDYLTDLDLSHNRLTSIDGFDLQKTTPRLKNLDLSFNYLERATALLRCKNMSLKTLKLEGNPLCHDYTDPDHYVRVLRMMFPSLVEIDGIPVKLTGDLPRVKQNYCPEEASPVVDKFLEVFFPLLDLPPEERARIEDMYDERATLTVTYQYKMRYSQVPRLFRNLFLRARALEDGEMESIQGAVGITKLLCRWPAMLHDPHTFTTDVMMHHETSTILRIGGILKLTAETLAEDEHMIAFTRTLVLIQHGGEYKIHYEMLYWHQPSAEYANMAFKVTDLRSTKRPSLKLDSAPDEELKEQLTKIFMKITNLDKKRSEKCLENNEWHLKHALENFMKLLKLDDLCSLDDKKVAVS